MTSPRRRLSSLLVFLLALCLAILSVSFTAAQLTRLAGAEPGESALTPVRYLEGTFERLSRFRLSESRRRIAYLGDSTVFSLARVRSLPHLLQTALRSRLRGRPPIEVHSISYPALGIISHYLMAGRLAEAKPDLIVWQTSFTHFSSIWRLHNLHSAFTGWVELERLPELVGMPIHRGGLTLDELLLYQGIIALDGVEAWSVLRDEQSRVGQLRERVESWTAGWSGRNSEALFRQASGRKLLEENVRRNEGRRRFTAKIEQNRYGNTLTGLDPQDLVLQMLGRALDLFARSGIPVIVYLNPMNIDNLATVGVLDEGELAQSVALLRGTVEAAGARFLDLHALFRDEYFRDAQGHLVHDKEINADVELVRELIDPTIAELKIPGR